MRDDGGWVRVHRRAFSEEDILWSENRERTRWEAWMDLLQLAAWKDHQTLYKGAVITLNRGQIPTSQRKLADRWRWTRGKVRRFLDLLEEIERVFVETREDVPGGGLTVLTIVNYTEYHARPTDRPTDRPTEGPATTGDSDTNRPTDEPTDEPSDGPATAQTEEGSKKGVRKTAAAAPEHEELDPSSQGPRFAELLPDSPQAVAVLESMEHPEDETATAKAIRARFLYEPSQDYHADHSVEGRPLTERRQLVANALLEMKSQGSAGRFAPRALAGFILGLGQNETNGKEPARANRDFRGYRRHDFGDETRRDEERRDDYAAREAAATRERAREETERSQAELRKLRERYNDLPPDEQSDVDEAVEERVRTMAAATEGRVPKAMRESALLTVLQDRAENQTLQNGDHDGTDRS